MTNALGKNKGSREEKRRVYNPALKIEVGLVMRNMEDFWLRRYLSHMLKNEKSESKRMGREETLCRPRDL